MGFLTFMSSSAGRWLRVVAGAVLVVVGLLIGGAGLVLSAVGLVPLLAGLFDVCVFAPLAGMPFVGKAFRTECERRGVA